MARIELTGGPLDGQERDLDTTTLAAELPGYAVVEEELSPEHGDVIKVEWQGSEADEASYPESRQERERRGNETGIRTGAEKREDADERRDPNDPNRNRTQDRTTGAERREAKNDASNAAQRSDQGKDEKK